MAEQADTSAGIATTKLPFSGDADSDTYNIDNEGKIGATGRGTTNISTIRFAVILKLENKVSIACRQRQYSLTRDCLHVPMKCIRSAILRRNWLPCIRLQVLVVMSNN